MSSTDSGVHVQTAQAVLHRIASAFNVTSATRMQTVQGMRRKPAEERTAYWFQLLIATGIAIFGLTLSSPGVVIGAMLIAPLMGPIVELAMSLAIGDAFLLVRSFARVTLSIGVVIATSLFSAWLLPFKTASAEVLARTSPTVLDLFVAVLCALAAAYTTVRDSSSAASAAAGTSIGISLVPPLCVVGFGLGIGDMAIAEGAMLLFTANFCAIVLCAGVFFALVGFRSSLAKAELDREIAALGDGAVARLMAGIQAGLRSRWRIVWRVGVPFALFAAVAIPLTTALQQLAWEMRTRTRVNEIVKSEPMLRDAVSVRSEVRRDQVLIQAVIVESDKAAELLQEQLTPRIAAFAGVVPQVRIRAIPPNEAIAARETDLPVEPTLSQTVDRLQARLEAAATAAWPQDGPALIASQWQLDRRELTVRLVHQGTTLTTAAAANLERAISARIALPVRVRTVGFGRVAAENEADLPAWWERAQPMLEAMTALPGVKACVEHRAVRRPQALTARIEEAIAATAASLGPERISLRPGSRWAVELLQTGDCAGK